MGVWWMILNFNGAEIEYMQDAIVAAPPTLALLSHRLIEVPSSNLMFSSSLHLRKQGLKFVH